MMPTPRPLSAPVPDTISTAERLLSATGILAVLCIFGAGFFSPDPPSHGAADTEVLTFYQAHATGVHTGAFLWAVALMALVVFAVLLARACERAWVSRASVQFSNGRQRLLAADLVSLFSAVFAAVFMVSAALGGVAAVSAGRGATASTVRTVDELCHLVGHFAMLPLGCFVCAAGVAQWTARRGARWIAGLGIASGATLAVMTAWVFVRQQWMHNAGVVGLLVFMVWSVASSISLLRNKRAATPLEEPVAI